MGPEQEEPIWCGQSFMLNGKIVASMTLAWLKQARPRALELVSDGTWDCHNSSRQSSRTIPPQSPLARPTLGWFR